MNVRSIDEAVGVPLASVGLPVASPPLVVDLDGTLVKTDLLLESILALIRKQPLCVFQLPVWLLRGKAAFKQEVARRVELDIRSLPWRRELLDDLERQHAQGRSLVLATGSDMRLARQVADHLGIFDLVFASDGVVNLCGAAKRDHLVRKFGDRGFDYAADGGGFARHDVAVWASARRAIIVNSEFKVQSRPGAWERLNALRPTHWLKNLLVFVPVFAAHRFHEIASLEKSLLAFVAFGCCASSGYLLNDLLDLEADRHHPKKRLRPFAAGNLPLSYALVMIPALLVLGCLLGGLVSTPLLGILLVYFAMSAAYSLHLKKIPILDVLFLAGLYTVRIMAGSAAVSLWLSPWLTAFSIFLFFSLALVKRYAELVITRLADGEAMKARPYEASDGELLAAMGTASGYLAVLVLALYAASDKAPLLYSRSQLLWFLCPLLLYWISHVWLTAHRGKMHHDPLIFAITDKTSRVLSLLMLAVAMAAL